MASKNAIEKSMGSKGTIDEIFDTNISKGVSRVKEYVGDIGSQFEMIFKGIIIKKVARNTITINLNKI